ncbi:hypothetical protein BFP72_06170 [Reichenbachiella sp. 5M10]|uniref:glycosyl hydrolase 108 family protein n=1 Tax=Reichenbachiella sp. 5M10 TaxID=1889772 RepID=UPI000C652D53|nr:glycosyl hydrolase 108 family protein [Reichenbachiella sp. 5M10]PIB35007.1 hypothetical protein BFP72_06170 [Reichenbachiella sp. 5M10]
MYSHANKTNTNKYKSTNKQSNEQTDLDSFSPEFILRAKQSLGSYNQQGLEQPLQRKEKDTALPDHIQARIDALSGYNHSEDKLPSPKQQNTTPLPDPVKARIQALSGYNQSNTTEHKRQQPARTKNAKLDRYTIKSGDTLSKIAKTNNLSLDQLVTLNKDLLKHGSKTIIHPGQVLLLKPQNAPETLHKTYLEKKHKTKIDNTLVALQHPKLSSPKAQPQDVLSEKDSSLSPFAKKQLEHIFKSEGGYVDDPKDPGGKTKYGIAEKREWPSAARFLGIDPHPDNIQNLTKEQAKEYYIHSRFEKYRINEISSEKTGNALLDQSVLTPSLINKNVKKALNSLGHTLEVNKARLSDIELQMLNKADPDKFVEEFVKLQNEYYRSLKSSKYEKGWLNRTKRLTKFNETQ